MAKQAKMKKGSIGKKALAAILAASMVLSSSAFSVLASVSVPGDGDVTVPDEGIATASLNENNGIATAKLEEGKILLGFRDPVTQEIVAGWPEDIVYNNEIQEPEVIVVHCMENHSNIKECYDATVGGWSAEGSTCKLVDPTKHYYEVHYYNQKSAAKGWTGTGGDTSIQDHGVDAEAKFKEAGPYACVNFSNNQQAGAGYDNPYAGLGSYFISYEIKPINLDDVQTAITNLQYGHTYNGKKIYPGMYGFQLQLGGEMLNLTEPSDFVALPLAPCTDLISASEVENENKDRPLEDKWVKLVGVTNILATDKDGDGEFDEGVDEYNKGNYAGTLGDQSYDGNVSLSNRNEPGYEANDFYPSLTSKTNDKYINYHINQKTNDNDIKISDDIKIYRRVGDSSSVTRASFIAMLNGEASGDLAGKGAKVIDSLRAENDNERYMTCYAGNFNEGYKNTTAWKEADYTVEFEKNGSWSADPDPTEGEHRFRITTTGEEDFAKGSTITGKYTVENPSRLQRAIEDYCKVGTGEAAKGSDKVVFAYDGTNHYPTTWKDGTTIKIGDNDPDDQNEQNTALEYGVDYTITSAKEEWKDAKDYYELTLQGLGGIKDETATIKVEVAPRNINQPTGTVQQDEAQGFVNKKGKPDGTNVAANAGNNGTANNIENTLTADGTVYNDLVKNSDDPKVNTKQNSAIRVLVEQGVHTNANLRSDVVVEIVDYGLDETVGDHGKVTLKEGVDYEVSEVKERVDETNKAAKIKYVEIKGIGNYTTVLSSTVTVYQEDIDQLDDMLLNSKRITASVDPATYTIRQKGEKIQLTTDNIKIVENTPGQEPKTLTMHEFDIQGYEQNGKWINTNEGITQPGEAYVIVGPADDSHYINTVKIPFTVTSADFDSAITIDPIDDCELSARVESLSGVAMAEHLTNEIVVRYKAEPTATFPTNDYTVTVKDKETGEALATRKYVGGEFVWYVGDGENPKADESDVIMKGAVPRSGEINLKRGEYTVVVESTDYRYEGTAETTFKVIGEDIAANGKTFTYTKAWSYTGKAIEPEVTVTTKDDIVLMKDRDYTVTYDYNTDAGTGRITLTGIGNYSGTHVETFAINQTEGTVAIEATQKAKLESGVDAGGSEAPVVEVTVNGEKVDDAKMTYSLSSSDTNVVAIAADGKTMNYVGAGTATITLTPSSTNVKADAITFTVTVNAAAVVEPEAHLTTKHYSTKAKTIGLTTNKIAEATKWQVRYATKKDMTGKHTKTVKKAKRLYHMTLNVKKSKTKYYVRVRAYVNGKWTKWSEKESIKSR